MCWLLFWGLPAGCWLPWTPRPLDPSFPYYFFIKPLGGSVSLRPSALDQPGIILDAKRIRGLVHSARDGAEGGPSVHVCVYMCVCVGMQHDITLLSTHTHRHLVNRRSRHWSRLLTDDNWSVPSWNWKWKTFIVFDLFPHSLFTHRSCLAWLIKSSLGMISSQADLH